MRRQKAGVEGSRANSPARWLRFTVTVNVIAPGPIDTALIAKVPRARRFRRSSIGRWSLSRLTPEDLWNVVSLLLASGRPDDPAARSLHLGGSVKGTSLDESSPANMQTERDPFRSVRRIACVSPTSTRARPRSAAVSWRRHRPGTVISTRGPLPRCRGDRPERVVVPMTADTRPQHPRRLRQAGVTITIRGDRVARHDEPRSSHRLRSKSCGAARQSRPDSCFIGIHRPPEGHPARSVPLPDLVIAAAP